MSGNLSALLAYTRRDFRELSNQGDVEGLGETRTLPNPQDGRSDAFLGKLVWDTGAHRIRLTGEHLETELFTDILSGQGPAFLFGPTPSWIVDDLTAVVARAEAAGAEQLQPREDTDYGNFAWFLDPDGRKIELWEPKEPEEGSAA